VKSKWRKRNIEYRRRRGEKRRKWPAASAAYGEMASSGNHGGRQRNGGENMGEIRSMASNINRQYRRQAENNENNGGRLIMAKWRNGGECRRSGDNVGEMGEIMASA
jgi:hypothetical protein